MYRLKLKANYSLTAQEIEFLNNLAPATHDAKYTTTEQRTINAIFYRLFGTTATGQTLVPAAIKAVKYPGGERLTTIAAQRYVIETFKNLCVSLESAPRKDHLTLLLNTMIASNSVCIKLCGLCLETELAETEITEAANQNL